MATENAETEAFEKLAEERAAVERAAGQEDVLAAWATLVDEMVDPNAAAPNIVRGQPRPLFLLSRPHVCKATETCECAVLEVRA